MGTEPAVEQRDGDDQGRPANRSARSRRRGRWSLAAVIALALPLLLARPASAQGGVSDNGWSCYRGGIEVNFPQVYKNDPNVQLEGVWVMPVIYKEVNGQWQQYASTTVVGLSSTFGMRGTIYGGTWTEQRTGRSMVRFMVSAPPGRYAAAIYYSWESTPQWSYFLSNYHGRPNTPLCDIPK